MSHHLLRFTSELYNRPHLITAQAFTPIREYLESRNLGDAEFATFVKDKTPAMSKPSMAADIAEIKVEGSLTYKPVTAMCGEAGMSYVQLLQQTQAAIDAGAKSIIFNYSSGGGQAQHAFDTAEELREMLTDNGVKSYAYIDTLAASAAYLLAVVADEVIIHPEASAGSIGCLVALKGMDEDEAKSITFITSADGKIPFDKEGKFTSSFLEDIQSEVSRLADNFVSHVAKYTGLSTESIVATNAKVFNAEKSLSLGLVNKIMTHTQFANYLTEGTK